MRLCTAPVLVPLALLTVACHEGEDARSRDPDGARGHGRRDPPGHSGAILRHHLRRRPRWTSPSSRAGLIERIHQVQGRGWAHARCAGRGLCCRRHGTCGGPTRSTTSSACSSRRIRPESPKRNWRRREVGSAAGAAGLHARRQPLPVGQHDQAGIRAGEDAARLRDGAGRRAQSATVATARSAISQAQSDPDTTPPSGLRSPVGSRHATSNAAAWSATPRVGFSLVDTHIVKAIFAVPDTSLKSIRLGQRLTVLLDALHASRLPASSRRSPRRPIRGRTSFRSKFRSPIRAARFVRA